MDGPDLSERGRMQRRQTTRAARFRKFGKLCFPNLRREADWPSETLGPKRSGRCRGLRKRELAGTLRAPRFCRRSAALCELGNVPFPNSTDSRGRDGGRRSGFDARTLEGRLRFCAVPFSMSAALRARSRDRPRGLAPNPRQGPRVGQSQLSAPGSRSWPAVRQCYYLSTKNSRYHTKKVYTVHTFRLLSLFPSLCSSSSFTRASVWKNFSASGPWNAAFTL